MIPNSPTTPLRGIYLVKLLQKVSETICQQSFSGLTFHEYEKHANGIQ